MDEALTCWYQNLCYVFLYVIQLHISCVSQLLYVIEDQSDMVDNGDPYDIVYLDLKEAYDQVTHRILAVIFEFYGIAR